MRIIVSEFAKADAREAAAFYEERVPGLGVRFLRELERSLEEIEATPLRFGRYERAPKSLNVRRALLRPFSYYVAFQVRSDEVFVAAVAHTSRRPTFWIKRLKQ